MATMMARERRAQSRARQYREASFGDDITSSYKVIDSLEQLEREIHGNEANEQPAVGATYALPGKAPTTFAADVVPKTHFMSRQIARQREEFEVESKHRQTAEEGWLREQRARASAQDALSKKNSENIKLCGEIYNQQQQCTTYQVQMLKEKKKRLRADAKYDDIEQMYLRKCAKLKRVIGRHRDYVEKERMKNIRRRKKEWCGLTGRTVEAFQTFPCCCIAFICYDKAPWWMDPCVMVCGDFDGKGQCMAVDERDTSGCIGQCCRMCRYQPGVKAPAVYRKLYPPKDMVDAGENVKYAREHIPDISPFKCFLGGHCFVLLPSAGSLTAAAQ